MKNQTAALECAAEEAARKIYLYDSSYPEELLEAIREWKALLPSLESAGLNWKDFLPHFNCEGERLW